MSLDCAFVEGSGMTSTICFHFLLFSHEQMRLPLRSFCIFRSVIAQGQAVDVQRRGLSGAAMRLVQFRRRGEEASIRVGVEQGEGHSVVDLKAFDPLMPSTMRELLELGDKGLECAQRYQQLSSIKPLINTTILLPYAPSTQMTQSSAYLITLISNHHHFSIFS